MRKVLVGFLAVGLLTCLVSLASADGLGLGIKGSPHDFSDNTIHTWNGRQEICRVCHVPHDHGRSTKYYLSGLLWNRALSSATYTMYDSSWSSTLTGVQSPQPDGTAKLCLGCHDGTVGLDTFDKYAGGSVFIDAEHKVPGFTDGGNLDLRGTHPISIAFPAGQIGDGKNFTDPATATWEGGGTVASTLDSGKVQCSTCHDVHDQETVPNTHLLRTAQTVAQGGQASGLCLTCHVK